MRTVLILIMLIASASQAADYSEERELRLDAASLGHLTIRAGAGSLSITGDADGDEIIVAATIIVPGTSPEKAGRKIEEDLVLYLEAKGDGAELHAYFDDSGFRFGQSPSVSLEVRIPARMNLDIDDGSGPIEIDDVRGNVALDDGSGSLALRNIGGDLEIDDGSGSITLQIIGGNIRIDDGSGSIKVRDVAGSVTIDDGSGGIDVSDVDRDLIIESDGSGGLNFSNIGGRVENRG